MTSDEYLESISQENAIIDMIVEKKRISRLGRTFTQLLGASRVWWTK
jgi:hypothetical protein